MNYLFMWRVLHEIQGQIIYDSMQYSVCSATALITTDNYLSSINKRQFVFKGPRHICYAK